MNALHQICKWGAILWTFYIIFYFFKIALGLDLENPFSGAALMMLVVSHVFQWALLGLPLAIVAMLTRPRPAPVDFAQAFAEYDHRQRIREVAARTPPKEIEGQYKPLPDGMKWDMNDPEFRKYLRQQQPK